MNINLFTKIDLEDVKVIANSSTGKSPTPIDIVTQYPPYITYTVDPCGTLFGNTICGVNNFQNFVVYNKPYYSINGKNTNPNRQTIFHQKKIIGILQRFFKQFPRPVVYLSHQFMLIPYFLLEWDQRSLIYYCFSV